MRYLSLPGTDLEVSQICLGSAEFGLKTDRAETFRLLDAFVARGGTFVDTAHCYSDWVPGEASRSEKVIGQWLEERGNRSRIVLATKGGIDFHRPGNPISLSEKDLDDDIGESLENLRTGTIDLYWLHRDEPSRSVDEIVRTLHLERVVRDLARLHHDLCHHPHREVAVDVRLRRSDLDRAEVPGIVGQVLPVHPEGENPVPVRRIEDLRAAVAHLVAVGCHEHDGGVRGHRHELAEEAHELHTPPRACVLRAG